MAASNSRSEEKPEIMREQGGNGGSDKNVVWSEHKRVPVLYYISKNGQLQHPHFMEVPLSSPRGLFLKDVINRLSALRGKGMPSMYSWSCKRSYKNGFVWHDLSENDLIFPAHGQDYILKGSEIPETAPPPEIQAADVSTETGDKELYRVVIDVSTPPSDSSPETLGTLMKGGGQVRARSRGETTAAAAGSISSSSHRHQSIQRCKSSVLMQLISCGSMPFKDCGAGGGQRAGLIGQHKMMRAPRGGGTAETGRVKLEEREFFSGSFVETKKREFPALKRSNSYNADRSLNLELAEKEIERLKAKCVPTKTKPHSSNRNEGSLLHY